MIGVVIDRNTHELRMVVDPDYEEQLDDPAFTKAFGEDRVLLKIERSALEDKVGMPFGVSTVAFIQENLHLFTGGLK